MTSVSKIEEKTPKTVGTKLTLHENEEIQNLIDVGMYLSYSDFIREAIRDKLKAIKVIKIREIDYDTAKKEILGYYKNYSEAYDYEVADDLELDYKFVCQILEELEKEGRLGSGWMSTYTKEGTTIEGDRIVGEARKISDPVTIVKTGRHKAQRIILKDNAMCRIAKKYRFIK